MKFVRLISFVVVCLCLSANSGSAAGIHSAVASGDADKISEELAKNASSINQPDDNGRTPLHIAVENNDARTVSLLISKGADPAAKDRAGKTPLRIAIESDSVGCVKLIVAKTSVGYIDPLLDARQKEGAEALKNGTLARANEMLGRLVRLDPASESLNFAYGLSWLSLGDPAPAGAALERVLQINPKNDRARVELARTRLAAKRYPEARKELEKVLAAELPADVKKTIESCLKDVNNRMTRWHHSGSIELAGLYDSNVNVGPDADLIQISPVTVFSTRITELEVSAASKPKDTTGISLTAAARALYDIGQPDGWLMTADASGYRNWLKESDYETASAQAGIGAKLMLDRGFIQVPFRSRYIEYGGEPLLWIHGLYPSFVYVPSSLDGVSFATVPSAELRNWDTLTDRDGYYVSLGQFARKSFNRGNYSLYGGVELQHDHTDSSEYEYNGTSLLAGSDARLPWRLSLFGEARYFYRNYRGKNPLAPGDRSDNQHQFSAGISRDISDRFAITLIHNIINNYSSFDLYEYKRQVTTLSTSVRF